MPRTNTPYEIAADVLDRAARLTPGTGVRLRFASREAAESYRFRLYRARTRRAALDSALVGPDHPDFGRTPWDGLVFLLSPDNVLWIGALEQSDREPTEMEIGPPNKGSL